MYTIILNDCMLLKLPWRVLAHKNKICTTKHQTYQQTRPLPARGLRPLERGGFPLRPRPGVPSVAVGPHDRR